MASLLLSPTAIISFPAKFKLRSTSNGGRRRTVVPTAGSKRSPSASPLQYRNLGDSELRVSEITLGTMTFGEQNTEAEAHQMLSYAFEHGVNTVDTAEAYPIPMKKETQGRTDLYIGSWMKAMPRDKVILATKVCGYSERSSYIRDNAKVLRVDAANIKESVEKSLKRLSTDYIDLLQIHWPDRYVAMFGEFSYDPTKWRPSVPFVEQLRAFQDLIDEGKVRYIGVSNETSYGVMEFVHAAKIEGLPKIVSIQNSYSLLARCKFEVDLANGTLQESMDTPKIGTMSDTATSLTIRNTLGRTKVDVMSMLPCTLRAMSYTCDVDLVEVCHPNNCNIGLLAYSPLGGGTLSGKYLDINSEAAKRGRLNLFPGYMERYNRSASQEATRLYVELAKKHGLNPVELALGFVRDRPFVTSSIIGATSLDQLKEDIDAIVSTSRPLPPEVSDGIEAVFKRYKDPAIL